jgi:hypothetical protein
MVEHLPHKHKAPRSDLSTAKKKKVFPFYDGRKMMCIQQKPYSF